MGKEVCGGGIDTYRVHFKGTAREVVWRWVNWLEMNMVIVIMASPIRI
jgi:hypothetical protein